MVFEWRGLRHEAAQRGIASDDAGDLVRVLNGPGVGFPGGGAEGTRIQVPIGGGGVSLTTLIVIGVIMWFLGINPLELLSEGQYPQVPQMPQQTEVPKAPRQATRGPDIPGSFPA